MTPVGGAAVSRLPVNPVASAVIGTDCRSVWRRAKSHLARRLSRGSLPAADLASRAVFVSYKTVFLQRNMTNDSAKPIKKADSDRPQPIDIARRLRQTRANMIGTDDEQHYWDCHEAADEIERLRVELEKTREYRNLAEDDASLAHLVAEQGLRLKCSEKAAMQFMLRHAAHAADEPAFPDSADYRLHSEALYGLMERTAKWGTTKPRNGAVCTPPTQPTPDECSGPNERT